LAAFTPTNASASHFKNESSGQSRAPDAGLSRVLLIHSLRHGAKP
jgi:hypothetical protein